mmetsp:Transcript_18847/g.26455  ORF Transcript_18847/g.26455 Transcript_18847/m.26455 type:complete len:129 (+) Transcript_18847:1200-1586(+)
MEGVFDHLGDLRDPSRPPHKDDLVDALLAEFAVLQNLVDGVHAAFEVRGAQVFETSTRHWHNQVYALTETLDLYVGGHSRRQSPLCFLAGCPAPPQRLGVPARVHPFVLLLECVDHVVHQKSIEILTA